MGSAGAEEQDDIWIFSPTEQELKQYDPSSKIPFKTSKEAIEVKIPQSHQDVMPNDEQ